MLPRYYLVDEINENSNKHNLQLSNVHFREIYVYEFIYFFYVYGEGRESNPIWTRVTKSDAFNCLAEPFFLDHRVGPFDFIPRLLDSYYYLNYASFTTLAIAVRNLFSNPKSMYNRTLCVFVRYAGNIL